MKNFIKNVKSVNADAKRNLKRKWDQNIWVIIMLGMTVLIWIAVAWLTYFLFQSNVDNIKVQSVIATTWSINIANTETVLWIEDTTATNDMSWVVNFNALSDEYTVTFSDDDAWDSDIYATDFKAAISDYVATSSVSWSDVTYKIK